MLARTWSAAHAIVGVEGKSGIVTAVKRKRPPRKSRRVTNSPAGRKPGGGDQFTAEKRDIFLRAYETGLSVREAAKIAGISFVTVFNWKRKNEQFRLAFMRAMETNTDVLEDDLHSMARAGNVAALFGSLKSRRPDKWRDNYKIEHAGSVLVTGAEQLQAARSRLEHARGNGHDKSPKANGDRQ